MTPGSRSTGAGGTPPGPARSSRPWSTRPWWSPAPTPQARCCPTWLVSSSPCTPSEPISPPRSRPWCRPTLMCQVLTSMPGIGVRTAAVFLAETLGKTFDTGAQLASYSGLAPVTRRSGSSIRGEHVSHGGNKRLKRAMFLSAFASLRSDPVSRTYYQRKRDQGKRHNQAVLALAYRRILTLHAMIRNDTLYDPQPATKLPTALTHHIGLPGARRAYASYKTSHNKDERLDSTTRPTKPVRPATAPETPRPAAPAPVGRQTNASQPSTQPRFRLIPDVPQSGTGHRTWIRSVVS